MSAHLLDEMDLHLSELPIAFGDKAVYKTPFNLIKHREPFYDLSFLIVRAAEHFIENAVQNSFFYLGQRTTFKYGH